MTVQPETDIQDIQKETSDSNSSLQKKGKVHLEWTPIKGVQGYFVQLKSKENDSIIFEKRVNSTSVDLELPPGDYLQRVGVINKFHKVSSFTDWTDLQVIRNLTPVIRTVQNGLVKIDEGEKLVNIMGEKFQNGSRVMLLKAKGGQTFDLTPEYQNESMIQIKVKPDQIPEGKYHVMVENPGGKRAQMINSVALYQKRPPDLENRAVASEELNDGKKVAALDQDGFRWTDLIIGVPRFRKKDYFIGSGQILVFSSLVTGSAVEAAKASKVAKTTAADFQYQMFNNFVLYQFIVRPTITNSTLLFNLGLKNYLDTDVKKQRYLWHTKNAVNFAGAAALVYMVHLVDAFGWIDISFGLSNSSSAGLDAPDWNTSLAQSSQFDAPFYGPAWELRFSIPIQ